MRKLWVKVLSGETEQPGRTSLRTLDVLRNMTKKDAQLFRNICDFAIGNFIFYSLKHKSDKFFLNYGWTIHAESIGLMRADIFLERKIEFDQNGNYHDVYQDVVLRVSGGNAGGGLGVPAMMLTDSGREIYKVMEHSVRMDYLRSFSRFLYENNCRLSYSQIEETLPNGELRFRGPFIPIEPEPEQPGATASRTSNVPA